jgi:uncharacterized protein
MPEIFADSFYWIALANPKDQWHQAAKNFSRSNPDATVVTTDEVLTEFLNYFAQAGEQTRGVVAEMCKHAINHQTIVVLPQSRESFVEGFSLYRERPDKSYSLTDCISMTAMRRRSIREALTHDHHFTQEGFAILL